MTVAVIVQARLGSKRFPGKVLADLCGHPVLWHVLTRAKSIPADCHVLAVSDEPGNEVIGALGFENGWLTFPGPESDVLARYHNAATIVGADVIVRITGDCPLLDVGECHRVLRRFTEDYHRHGGMLYSSNTFPCRTAPSGHDCEVFSMGMLSKAHEQASDASDREHVTPFMQRSMLYRQWRGAKLSVDTPDDLALIVAQETYKNEFLREFEAA